MKVVEVKETEYYVQGADGSNPVKYVVGTRGFDAGTCPYVKPVAMFIHQQHASDFIRMYPHSNITLFKIVD